MTGGGAVRTFILMMPLSYVPTAFSDRERPRPDPPPRRASPAQRPARAGLRGVRIGAVAGGLAGICALVGFVAL
jgi:hypothetical protein